MSEWRGARCSLKALNTIDVYWNGQKTLPKRTSASTLAIRYSDGTPWGGNRTGQIKSIVSIHTPNHTP